MPEKEKNGHNERFFFFRAIYLTIVRMVSRNQACFLAMGVILIRFHLTKVIFNLIQLRVSFFGIWFYLPIT